MKVVVTRQFEKDVDKELSKELKLKVADLIEDLQKVSTLQSISKFKKIKRI